MMHKFDPLNAHRLDNPGRTHWQDPAAVIRALGVARGMACLDVGAGTGFFTRPLAEAVGPEGHVYALDVSREMVDILAARLGDAQNVTVLLSEESALPLEDGTADLVLLVNVFHELADPHALLREARRVLRPGGRIAVMDWARRDSVESQPGPPMEHRVPAAEVAARMALAGFVVLEHSGATFPYHCLLVGRR